MEPKCVGCGRKGGPVCPGCREFSVGVREIRATRAPLWIALSIDGFLLLLLVYGVVLESHWGRGARITFYAGWMLVFTAAWTLAELRRPQRFDLRGDVVTVGYVFGVRRWIELASLRLVPGAFVDGVTGVRYRLGEDRFSGAADFHRALRVRLALLDPIDRDPAVP